MLNADDHRRSAAECLELARRAGSSRDKSRLLALAEAWLDLADHADRLRRRGTPREHPLIRAKLGPPASRELFKPPHH